MRDWLKETDPDLLSEAALAKAQAMMDRAMTNSHLTEEDLAACMRPSPWTIPYLLSSQCDLTVKTLGRFLAICGYRLSMDVHPIPAMAAPPVRLPQDAPVLVRDVQEDGLQAPAEGALVSPYTLAA